MTTPTTPEQDYCFQDNSSASPTEKARRVMTSLADPYGPSAHFFDDGFPRGCLHQDASATLAVFNSLAAQVEALTAERDSAVQAAKYAEHIDATPENKLQTMLYDTLKERDSLRAELDRLKKQEPVGYYCKPCRETGLSHCSDPVNCGAMQRTYLAPGAQPSDELSVLQADAEPTDKLKDLVNRAMHQAWKLGQTYQQLVDSEYGPQHKATEATQARFSKLACITLDAIDAPGAQPAEIEALRADAARYAAKRKEIFLKRNRMQVSGPRSTEEEFNSEYDANCDKAIAGYVADHRGVLVFNSAMVEAKAAS